MREITATEASKRFADLLDAVEHHGETVTITRRGKTVATIAPARRRATLADLQRIAREHPVDEGFARDIAEVKRFIIDEPMRDPWSD